MTEDPGAPSARFLRACRRLPVDATPVWFMRQAGRSLPAYRRVRERATLAGIVGDAALCAEVTLQPVEALGVDAAILFADITTPLAGIGVPVELVEGVGPLIGRPVRGPEDLATLRPFDAEDSVGALLEAIRLVRAASRVPLIGFAGAPFTLASYIVEGRSSPDARRLRLLLHAEPEMAEALLDRLTEMTIAYLGAQVAAGVQAVQLFDSWLGALSPADHERFVLPRTQRIVAAIARLGIPVIVFGTGTAGLLPDLARTGADVVGVDWRVELAAAWAMVPERGIQGNLDPVIALAPWPEVEAAARRVLAGAGGRPGHVFNLGHGVLPETDPDVLRRLVDLVHEATAPRGDARSGGDALPSHERIPA